MNKISPDEFLRRIRILQAQLTPIWENGRPPKIDPHEGPHWTLPGRSRPVSIGRVESYLLFNLVVHTVARKVFEIGTGFGYSSWWLAGGTAQLDGQRWLGSLDNYTEGTLGIDGFNFAKSGASRLGLADFVHYFWGNSPDIVSQSIGRQRIDLVFIDGDHLGNQPIIDYQAVVQFLHSKSIVVFHDATERYSVPRAILMAKKDGWIPIVLPTSCDMAVCIKDQTQRVLIEKSFQLARNFHLCKFVRV